MTIRTFGRDHPDDQADSLALGDQLLAEQLSAVQLDDRFRNQPDWVAVLRPEDQQPGLLGVAAVTATERRDGSSLPPWTMQLALRSGNEDRLCELVTSLLPPEGVELWVRPEIGGIVGEIQRCWPQAYNCRRLHLMEMELPPATEPLTTRPLDPGSEADLEAVVRVNNAAFQAHPDQAGMTVETVRAKLAGIGHSARGVRLAEIDGRVNGFCWTQIHHQRMLGEISVIGLHPDVHGRGLGAPVTAAGLHWLHRQGLTNAFLYVEAGNTAAVRSYERLGFRVAHDDVSWMITP